MEKAGGGGQGVRGPLEVRGDDWIGESRGSRCCGLRRGGDLSQQSIGTLYSTTFLSHDEIQDCWTLFTSIRAKLKQRAEEKDDPDWECTVDRTITVDGIVKTEPTDALTAEQLREFLPEFECNTFFERLVEVFSESGDSRLTFLELLDMYSTLSPDAPVKWKARACFCVFDFDEDNKLSEKDLLLTLMLMTKGTHKTSTRIMEPDAAAVSIQRIYRGFRMRKEKAVRAVKEKEAETTEQSRTLAGITEKGFAQKDDDDHPKGRADTSLMLKFIATMTQDCNALESGVMTYEFFESTMCGFKYFADNFTVTMTDPRNLLSADSRLNRSICTTRCGRKDDTSIEQGETVEDYADVDDDTTIYPGSPESERAADGSPRSPNTAASHQIQKVGKAVWSEHVARRGLGSRLKTMKTMEVKRMVTQNVPLPDGKVRADGGGEWHDKVDRDEFLTWFSDQASNDGVLEHTKRMLKLNEMWPSWTEHDPQNKSEEEERPLNRDVAQNLYNHMKLRAWRVKRATRFREFCAKVQNKLTAGSKSMQFSAKDKFKEWDRENNRGLGRQELSEGLCKLLGKEYEYGELRHEADLLMYMLVDLDPHGAGFICAQDFTEFWERVGDDDNYAYERAMEVTKLDLTGEWTWDRRVAETRAKRIWKEVRGTEMTAKHEANYLPELVTPCLNDPDDGNIRDLIKWIAGSQDDDSTEGRGSSDMIDPGVGLGGDGNQHSPAKKMRVGYVWSWRYAEESFKKWWGTFSHVTVASTRAAEYGIEHANDDAPSTTEETVAAVDAHISKRDFVELFWLSTSTSNHMIDAASEVKWRESLQWCEELWGLYDSNSSGWISEADTTKLLGRIVGHTGAAFRPAEKKGRLHTLHLWGLHFKLNAELRGLWHQRKEAEAAETGQNPRDTNAITEDEEIDGRIRSSTEDNKEIEEWLALHPDDFTGLRQLRGKLRAFAKIGNKLAEIADDDDRKDLKGRLEKVEDDQQKLTSFDKFDCGITTHEAIIAGIVNSRSHVIRVAAFKHWWRQQNWLTKQYTHGKMQLDSGLWDTIVGPMGGNCLSARRAIVVLIILWDVKEHELVSEKGRGAFHRRFLSWLHEYDRDESGRVDSTQFSEWWVQQHPSDIQRGIGHDWSKIEVGMDQSALVEALNSMLEQIEEDVKVHLHDIDDPNQKPDDKREERISEHLTRLDSEIHRLDSEGVEGVDLLLATAEKRTHGVIPYGLLTGGSRPPLLRTRVRLVRHIEADENREYLEALNVDASGTGCIAWVRTCGRSKEATKDAPHLMQAGISDQTVAERKKERMNENDGGRKRNFGSATLEDTLGDFTKQGRFRCRSVDLRCMKTVWKMLYKLMKKASHLITGDYALRLRNHFPKGVAEIVRRMEYMFHMNIGLSFIWLVLVVIPREHSSDGGGLVNTTRSVFAGVFWDHEGVERSLYYDGYVKEPVVWPTQGFGMPLRMDLLYFVAIIATVLFSLNSLTRRLGMHIDQLVQGVHTQNIGVKRDSEARKCAEVLGLYNFGVTDEVSAAHMRQRVRKHIDNWVKQQREDLDLAKLAWRFNDGDASCSTRCRWLGHESRLAIGLIATVTLLILHVYALGLLLIYRQTVSAFGASWRVDSLMISILDAIIPVIISQIVMLEGHVKHGDELRQIMYRIYATKMIQLIAILYSLAKISSCQGDGTDAIRIGGVDVCQGVEKPECVEALFGQTFFRLAFSDAAVSVVGNYLQLYMVNRGLFNPFQYRSSSNFRHTADVARARVLDPSLCQRCCGCWRILLQSLTYNIDDSDLIPGMVEGTDWEIVDHDRTQPMKTRYRFKQTDDDFEYDKQRPELEQRMPLEVKAAIHRTFVVQQRVNPSNKKHEREWWKRRPYRIDDTTSAEIRVTFDPRGTNVELDHCVKFDWDCHISKRRCRACQRCLLGEFYEEIGPLVLSVMHAARQHGLEDIKRGMGLVAINRVSKNTTRLHEKGCRVQGKTKTEVLDYLLQHRKEELVLTFKASSPGDQSVVTWATSKAMQNMTAGAISYDVLTLLALMLIDAGKTTKQEVEATNWNPDELVLAISKQRGRHQYRYRSKAAEKALVSQLSAPLNSDAPDPGAQFTTVMTLCSDHDSLTLNHIERRQAMDVDHEEEMQRKRDCIVSLQGGVLSLYETKTPEEALETALGLVAGPDEDEPTLTNDDIDALCGAIMGVDSNSVHKKHYCFFSTKELQKELRAAMQTMSFYTHGEEGTRQKNDKISDKVSFVAFKRWWNDLITTWPSSNYWASNAANGGTVLGKALRQLFGTSATAHIYMQDCISVHASASVIARRITVQTLSRRLTLSWSPTEAEQLRMESGQPSWEAMLRALVPVRRDNWGHILQHQTDDQWDQFVQKYGHTHKAKRIKGGLTAALGWRVLARKAEQHVANGYRFAASDDAANRVAAREIFDQYDVDRNGFLNRDEVRKLLERLHTKDKKGKLRRIHDKDLQHCIAEMEAQSKLENGQVDFDEFSQWWEARKSDRKLEGLGHEHWVSLRQHAVEEFEAASRTYERLETAVREAFVDEMTNSSSRCLNLDVDFDQKAAKGGSAQLDRRRAVLRLRMQELQREAKDAGVDDATTRDFVQILDMMIRKRQIVEWCAHGEEYLSTMRPSKHSESRTKWEQKSSSQAFALHYYEKALRCDETNPHVRGMVQGLTRLINRKARQIKHSTMLDFATQLIRCQGEWEEVTEEVNRQSHVFMESKRLSSTESANLLMSSIYRQGFVWVGTTWCPWLPVVAALTQVLVIKSLGHAMLGTWWARKPVYVATGSEWAAEETYRNFMNLSLLTYLLTAVPLLIWLNQEPVCGPHSVNDEVDAITGEVVACEPAAADGEECGHGAKVYETPFAFIQWLEESSRDETHFLTGEVQVISSFFFTPPVLFLTVFVMWTRYRYYRAQFEAISLQLQDAREDSAAKEKHMVQQHKAIGQNIQAEKTKYSTTVQSFASALRQRVKTERPQQQSLTLSGVEAAKRQAHRRVAAARVMLKGQQLAHDARMLQQVNKFTDRMLLKMDETGRLARVLSLNGSIAEAQIAMELAACGMNGRKFVEMSTMWVGNIDAEFATEPLIVRELKGATFDGAIVACSVCKLSKRAVGAFCEGNSANQKYPHASWALCTFVSPAYANKVHVENAAPPCLDPTVEQTVRGSALWHVIPWSRASEMFGGQLEGLPSPEAGDENATFMKHHYDKVDARLQKATSVQKSASGRTLSVENPIFLTGDDWEEKDTNGFRHQGRTSMNGTAYTLNPIVADASNSNSI